MTQIIRARPGSPFNDEDAQVIYNFLRDNFPSGTYTPEQIVDLARNRNSPIHEYFDWNDSSAAKKYRLQQARRMVTSVVVEVGPRHQTSPVAVSVSTPTGREYWATEKAQRTPDIWELVINEAYRGLNAWKIRYENLRSLKQLKPVFNTIDKEVVKWQEQQAQRAQKNQRPRRLRKKPKSSRSPRLS